MSMTLCIKDQRFEIDDLNFAENPYFVQNKSVNLETLIIKNCKDFPVELKDKSWVIVDYIERSDLHYFTKINNSLVVNGGTKDDKTFISFIVNIMTPWKALD